MRRLVYYVATTIDGFIAAPDGGMAAFPTEGDHIEAIIAEYPETIPGHMRDQMGLDAPNRHFDTVVMGRGTYQPAVDLGVPNLYPQLRQYVVTRTMERSPHPAVELVTGDPVAKVRELKAEDGLDIWLCGGGALAGVLYPEVDELFVKINPVVFGSGTPLFGMDFQPSAFEPAGTTAYRSGVVTARYLRP
ncbi:dihydrofolate reductase family protein [Allonocardiopsis opalescens]|uniref:Dihydrofolate reductase n=1 Tax=Allonocardiopsis opalescens TaxID=1144618 RepID=A0A2T0Q4Z9_9ACTN|nr:dihydrofolate reductase family protein [Allonocardiopsis opalescens]PRX98882.1 dihydrofolate reductase [Allonocardiopsis opalescens]